MCIISLNLFSLLLAVVIATSWFASPWYRGYLRYLTTDQVRYAMVSDPVGFSYSKVFDRPALSSTPPGWSGGVYPNWTASLFKGQKGYVSPAGITRDDRWEFFGFRLHSFDYTDHNTFFRPDVDHHQLSATVPYWFLLLLTLCLPSLALVRRYRHRSRRKEGHCRRCGYDLRATPVRCPECGTPALLPAHQSHDQPPYP